MHVLEKKVLREQLATAKNRIKQLEFENENIWKLEMLLGVKQATVCDDFRGEYLKKWAQLDNITEEVAAEWYDSDGELTRTSSLISGKLVKVFPDADTYFELEDNNFVIHSSMLTFKD